MEALQELDLWKEWRRCCAFARLNDEERACLTHSVARRFCQAVRRYCDHQGLSSTAVQAPPPADCAHLFETHCQLHQRAEGKMYKHWLLERGTGDLDSVQSGVALLLRMVVREWLRRERKGLRDMPLDQPPPGAAEPLVSLLAAPPAAEDLTPEVDHWIHRHLPAWIHQLHPLQRKVLLIRRSGRELYDPQALREHAVGKSSLYAHQRALFETLAHAVQTDFPGISPELGARVVLDILETLGTRL